ncbi:MAG: sigma-70 family RNA polymerase sigma factor [Vitreoscilla sp.]|nr:sigma-70 family RNA polymerase sigma factor [Vitreoscilla sp.]
MDTLSELIRRIPAGDAQARDALFSAAYGELRKLARSRLRDGGRDVLLQTSALVHETYLRFVRGGELRAEDRRAYFAYASQVMRSVIIDAVRERQALHRGGPDLAQITLDTQVRAALPLGGEQILQVHEALDDLARAEPRLAQVVEMRYFGGYSDAEIAEALDLTTRTVRRDWSKARMLLLAFMQA